MGTVEECCVYTSSSTRKNVNADEKMKTNVVIGITKYCVVLFWS